ncbi:tetratricopeptide repeat protein [Thalassoroseus pseudoceratinae]|uniref:tetratricopeptide repeat protein n=1 Tax=Thalassoroseus pseudoceratinae TaxID=2713176 RepID=UPI001424A6A5|nr:tetratricopeptide repeat protein [Thalassoroseus pseudoceratinae]
MSIVSESVNSAMRGFFGSLVMAFLVVGTSSAELRAANSPVKPGNPMTTKEPKANTRGFQLQPGDDELKPLVPKQARTAGVQSRLDAMAWFMTGELRERRNDFTGALDAYKKAVELDSEAIEIYRQLVPLAFSLGKKDDAVRYGLKAVELDPNDFRLLRRLGIHLATERDMETAVELLEKAVQSKTLDKKSGQFVTLNRDLAVIYGVLGETKKAADSYSVVFEALTDPETYSLDFRLRRALEADPASSYERCGQAFLADERLELAAKAFEKAAAKSPGQRAHLGFDLARVYLKSDEPKKSLEQLQAYFDAQLQSKGRAAYELLADILEKLDQSDELTERLEKLAEKDNKNQTLQFFLAEQYLEKDQLGKAEKLYLAALERAKSAEGYAGLASVYRRQNKPTDLLQALTEAVSAGAVEDTEILADELEAIARDEKLLNKVLATADRQLADSNLDFAGSVVAGRLAVRSEKTEEAVKFFENALESERGQSNTLYSELGEYLFEVRDYEAAAKWFQRASEDPIVAGSKPNWLFRLSQARVLTNDTDGALKAVREAKTLLPNVALLHYQEAWIEYYAENYDKALELFAQLEKDFPADRDTIRRAQYIISNIYVQKGDMRKGEQVLEKVYAEDPDDVSVNNDLGYLYADQGKNLEQAKKMIEKALEAEPENGAYLDSMGWVLYKLGQHKEALPYLEKAVEQEDGGDATIWDHLGDVYVELGQPKKAVDAWQKALKDAKEAVKPDEKLIGRIKQKLAAANAETQDKTEE